VRVLISGSHGFIGSHVVLALRNKGHEVIRLVRTKGKDKDTIYWDPQTGDLEKKDFEGFDAVIHLAGENLAGRWTKKKKQRLFLSRCRDTWLLSQVLVRLCSPPKVLICASAVGYYGNRPGVEVDESSPPGKGFLAELCVKWENATEAIEERGTRVIHARCGIVLDPSGGMQKKILPLLRWGLGAYFGKGSQKMSWVALADAVQAILFCFEHAEISGAVNVVAPQSVSQKEFIKQLAQREGKKAFSLPEGFVRLFLGEMGETLLLSSCTAQPKVLLRAGFRFQCQNFEDYTIREK